MVGDNKFMNRHNRIQENKAYTLKTLRLSKQKVEEVGERMYKEAMKHVKKFNKLETQIHQKKEAGEKLTDQHTFKPKIFTKNYQTRYQNMKVHKKTDNPENRLMQWGYRRDKKKLQKSVQVSVEKVEESIPATLNNSLDKISVPSQKILKNLSFTQVPNYQKTKLYAKSQASFLNKTTNSSYFY